MGAAWADLDVHTTASALHSLVRSAAGRAVLSHVVHSKNAAEPSAVAYFSEKRGNLVGFRIVFVFLLFVQTGALVFGF